jgi:hypothetical protein
MASIDEANEDAFVPENGRELRVESRVASDSKLAAEACSD